MSFKLKLQFHLLFLLHFCRLLKKILTKHFKYYVKDSNKNSILKYYLTKNKFIVSNSPNLFNAWINTLHQGFPKVGENKQRGEWGRAKISKGTILKYVAMNLYQIFSSCRLKKVLGGDCLLKLSKGGDL